MENNIQPIGEILQRLLQANLAQHAKFKICKSCNEVTEPGMFDVCPRCHRRLQFEALPKDEQEHLIAGIIPPRYKDAAFGNLPGKLLSSITALPKHKGLMLWGSPGVGKTYATCAIIRDSISHGYTVQRTLYEMLCLRIRDTYKSNSRETELSIILPLLNCQRLFIEDIGTTKSEGNIESDFSVRTLLVLLDYRLEQMLPVYFTTNRPVEELAKTFDERIASRIIQGCEIIKLAGEDRRKRKNAN